MATTNGFSTRTDSLKDTASGVLHKVIDVKDTVVSGGKTGAIKVGSLIKAHPFAAIGIAIGIAYLTMRMIRR